MPTAAAGDGGGDSTVTDGQTSEKTANQMKRRSEKRCKNTSAAPRAHGVSRVSGAKSSRICETLVSIAPSETSAGIRLEGSVAVSELGVLGVARSRAH